MRTPPELENTKFEKNTEMRILSIASCKQETGYNAFELLSLTGVFGIHEMNDFISLYSSGDITFKIFFDDDDTLNVEIRNSPAIDILRAFIKYPKGDEIYVDLFRLKQSFKGAHVGFKRLKSQIDAAKSLNFSRISLWAYGDISKYPLWDGYIVWGKYGFSMSEQNEKHNFNLQMTEDRLNHCSTINHLMKSKEGTAYWKYQGKDWHGEFILADNSHNMNVYREYGFSRNLF